MDKTLANFLWTARWGLNNNDTNTALKNVTAALVHIGAEKPSSPDPEPDRPDDPMPPDYLKGIREPKFVTVKGVRYADRGAYATPSGMFEGLVVHYTVSGRTAQSARNVVSYLASKGLGCMVMDEDGVIYIPEGFDVLRDWGQHAGVSRWGSRSSVSNRFAGMEICCWGKGSKVGPFRSTKGEANMIAGTYQTFTKAQEEELENFILWARTKNKEFKLENVAGHDELREQAGKKGDKQDPGASLSVTMPAFRKHLIALEKELKTAGEEPVVLPADPEPIGPAIPFLSWEDGHPERKDWSAALAHGIRKTLSLYNHSLDVATLFPKWGILSDAERVKLLGEFWVALAERESDFDPTSKSVDVGDQSNRDSWSIGLFQLSVRDSANKASEGGPGFTFDQLLTAEANILLATRTMGRQLEKTGLIVLPATHKMKYWAPILEGGKYNKLPQILARVKKYVPQAF